MIFILTGNGKGKTTSAMGMVLRGMGQGFKCAVFQFIKTSSNNTGEFKILNKEGVHWENFGDGFTWMKDDLSKTSDVCKAGWTSFKNQAEKFDLIVLDEFTYVLNMHILDESEVINYLKGLDKYIIITGRDASTTLINSADTVSEIKEIKHHYNLLKTSLKGIEF